MRNRDWWDKITPELRASLMNNPTRTLTGAEFVELTSAGKIFVSAHWVDVKNAVDSRPRFSLDDEEWNWILAQP